MLNIVISVLDVCEIVQLECTVSCFQDSDLHIGIVHGVASGAKGMYFHLTPQATYCLHDAHIMHVNQSLDLRVPECFAYQQGSIPMGSDMRGSTLHVS